MIAKENGHLFWGKRSCVLLHLFYETKCSSPISIQVQVLSLSKLVGTDSELKRKEGGGQRHPQPTMALELLSFVGMLPRHLLIETMGQDVNLAQDAKIANLRRHCRRMSGII